MELIDKSSVVAEIERRRDLHYKYYVKNGAGSIAECKYEEDRDILDFLDTIDVKESDKTAEAFARIIRANLTGIDKDVQYKFEQLYKEITGEKMYQGYKD